MIDHIWTVVCSHAVIDRESNNISLLDVVEQITIQGEPRPGLLLPMRVDVASLWVRTDPDVPGHGAARLTVLSPSGAIGPRIEMNLDLSKRSRIRTRSGLPGLPLRETGRYIFRVEFLGEGETEWHQVANVPIDVQFVPMKNVPPTSNLEEVANSEKG